MGPCQDSRWHRKPADYPTKSMLCAPVLLEGKVVAVIQLLNKRLGLKRGCFFFWLGSWGVGNTATDGGCWGYCNLEVLNTWTLVEVFVFCKFYLYFLFYYYFLRFFKYVLSIPFHIITASMIVITLHSYESTNRTWELGVPLKTSPAPSWPPRWWEPQFLKSAVDLVWKSFFCEGGVVLDAFFCCIG